MEQGGLPAGAGQEAARMLGLARALQEAATRAGRPEVAAKAEEAIRLLVGETEPNAKGNAVLRFLDGLGF